MHWTQYSPSDYVRCITQLQSQQCCITDTPQTQWLITMSTHSPVQRSVSSLWFDWLGPGGCSSSCELAGLSSKLRVGFRLLQVCLYGAQAKVVVAVVAWSFHWWILEWKSQAQWQRHICPTHKALVVSHLLTCHCSRQVTWWSLTSRRWGSIGNPQLAGREGGEGLFVEQ